MEQTADVRLEPHQQRVVDERSQLAERVGKLGTFVSGAIIHTLPLNERELLFRQFRIMRDYLAVLDDRIALFKPNPL